MRGYLMKVCSEGKSLMKVCSEGISYEGVW